MPVVLDVKESVISEAGSRGVPRLAATTPDDSNGQTLIGADGQGAVSTGERLVGNGLARGVPATVAGVDDLVTKVLVILIAARNDDRVRALRLPAGYPGFKRAMNAGVCELSTARKRGALSYSRDRPEHPLSHKSNLPRNAGGQSAIHPSWLLSMQSA
jgi:hypothetical protein